MITTPHKNLFKKFLSVCHVLPFASVVIPMIQRGCINQDNVAKVLGAVIRTKNRVEKTSNLSERRLNNL